MGFGADMSHSVRLRLLFLRIILPSSGISSDFHFFISFVFFFHFFGLRPADSASPLQLQQDYQRSPLFHWHFHGYAEGFPYRHCTSTLGRTGNLEEHCDHRLQKQMTGSPWVRFGADMSHAIRLRLLFLQIILPSSGIFSNANKVGIGLRPAYSASPLQLEQYYQKSPPVHWRFHGYAEGFPLPKLHFNA